MSEDKHDLRMVISSGRESDDDFMGLCISKDSGVYVTDDGIVAVSSKEHLRALIAELQSVMEEL